MSTRGQDWVEGGGAQGLLMIAGGHSPLSQPLCSHGRTLNCLPPSCWEHLKNKGLLLWEPSPSTWPVTEQATVSVRRLTKLTCMRPASQVEGQQSLCPHLPFLVWAYSYDEGRRTRGNRNKRFPKSLFLSSQLTSFWPEQVMWPTPVLGWEGTTTLQGKESPFLEAIDAINLPLPPFSPFSRFFFIF